jgi:hypothetical protein
MIHLLYCRDDIMSCRCVCMCVAFFKDVYLDSLGVKQYVVCVCVRECCLTPRLSKYTSLKNATHIHTHLHDIISSRQ